ncbi:RNA binding motif protein 12Bb [Nematolebias whitei]|uniref:RNA binding motif protein 12Bb n=1 Tax=Nematolebias whitei TaxID=451745 RepID=UPI00189A7F09|nr:RNA binding motif protein 12Bb [Nematolebias whitei]XP_037532262.1 RNA binding motif protein 12Bb [Nematolebias whitei]XP_037532263.1 RNA binding motif protein 12Bb [Nematolebias whitei]
MEVVIRLQGLSGMADSGDVRRFFTGLHIPDGGVHIIGGKREEAFIIFASDEDARRAMTRSGGCIMDSPVTLLLSSKTEMQKLLERTAQHVELDQKNVFDDDVGRAQRYVYPEVGPGSSGQSGYSPDSQHQRPSQNEEFCGVFLKGLPFMVTEDQIRNFFSGLTIDQILLLKHPDGRLNGMGFVRFATRQDVGQALRRDGQYIGTRYIDVRRTYSHDWFNAVAKMRMLGFMSEDVDRTRSNKTDHLQMWRSPGFSRTNPQRDRSRSPVAQRNNSPSIGNKEYCVMLENLSFSAEVEHVKLLFPDAKLKNDQILFLTDKYGQRTRSALVLFRSRQDFSEAFSPERKQLWHQSISARPISKDDMVKLMGSQNENVRPSGNLERSEYQEGPSSYPRNSYDTERSCVFVRYLPFDVRKVEILSFFRGFNVTEDKVHVLHDHSGAKVGQALVVFGSEAEAMETLRLNGRQFLGCEVMMNCITRSQMKQLVDETLKGSEPMPREEQYSGRSSEASFPPDNSSYPDASIARDGNMPMANTGDRFHGGSNNEPRAVSSHSPRYKGNGADDHFGPPAQHLDSPTCVQMINLPFTIKCEEIYDFCHGYHVIPGSVSLEYERGGAPKGSATLLFESYQEALSAAQELSGRPIGLRKVQLFLA